MEKKVNWRSVLEPALQIKDANGRERLRCIVCKHKAKKGDSLVELYGSRFCRNCFIRTILHNFPELLDDNFINKMRKEVVIDNL